MRCHPAVPALSLLFVAVALSYAPAARGATTPPGVNIRWDNCYDDGGALNKAFACDTEIGVERLVLSFALDAAKSDVSGLEIVVDLTTTGQVLPAWWQFRNAGTCRQTSLGINPTLPPGTVHCLDWGNGQAVSAIGSYTLGFAGPGTARLTALAGVPAEALATFAAGTEYFITQFTINHFKTVGTGACAGCAEPVCIVFNSLNIVTPDPAKNQNLLLGANGTNSQFVHWQGALVQGLHLSCPSPFRPCKLVYSCVLAATPTRRSRWGEVKALYR